MSHSTWFVIFIISLILSVTGAAATIILIIKFGILSSVFSLKKSISEMSVKYSDNNFHPVKTENLSVINDNSDYSDRAASGTVVINRSTVELTGTVLASGSFSVTKSIIISYGNPDKVKAALRKYHGNQ